MHRVHIILAATAIAIASIVTGCSSTAETTEIPAFHEKGPPPPAATADPLPRPRGGFIADMRTRVFHRPECRDAKDIPEIEQVEFETPWPAINDAFEPCPRCHPMTGWK